MQRFNTEQQDAKNHFSTAIKLTGLSTQPDSVEEEKADGRTLIGVKQSVAFRTSDQISSFDDLQEHIEQPLDRAQ